MLLFEAGSTILDDDHDVNGPHEPIPHHEDQMVPLLRGPAVLIRSDFFLKLQHHHFNFLLFDKVEVLADIYFQEENPLIKITVPRQLHSYYFVLTQPLFSTFGRLRNVKLYYNRCQISYTTKPGSNIFELLH